jgi:hypothetical protein
VIAREGDHEPTSQLLAQGRLQAVQGVRASALDAAERAAVRD